MPSRVSKLSFFCFFCCLASLLLCVQGLVSGGSWRNKYAFAALKQDDSVVTWGGSDSTSVASLLSDGVVTLYCTFSTFAALKQDGSVVTWGVATPQCSLPLIVT